MRINTIENKKVNVTMTSDDLVMINNIIYFYENHADEPTPALHDLAKQVIIASNLCQYGHLDNFALDTIVRHTIEANPEIRMHQIEKIMKGESKENIIGGNENE